MYANKILHIFRIPVRAVAAVAVTIAATLMLMIPTLPRIEPGNTPPGSPLPDTPGGGGSPNFATNPAAAAAVALVPAGLTAVAVFPPFETPRTLPAIAVIFSEEPTRRKRETYSSKYKYPYKAYFYMKKNISSYIYNIWWKVSDLYEKISECKNLNEWCLIQQRVKIFILLLVMKKFMNNMQCLQPRLARKFAKTRSKYKLHDMYNRQDMDDEEEDEIDSLGKHYQIKLSCLCPL